MVKKSFFFSILFILATSCIIEKDEIEDVVPKYLAGSGGSSTQGSVTSPVSAGGGDNDSYEKKWHCGFEKIVVKDPSGNIIEAIVPLECDPFADKYFGDPSPFINKK